MDGITSMIYKAAVERKINNAAKGCWGGGWVYRSPAKLILFFWVEMGEAWNGTEEGMEEGLLSFSLR